jgi:hypothetical protein
VLDIGPWQGRSAALTIKKLLLLLLLLLLMMIESRELGDGSALA